MIAVHPQARRAHQGWRYLDAGDVPADLDGENHSDVMPGHLVGELAKLGLM